ncbi:MAG: hypothetical protein NWF06_10585 [Candidatus Bathyarchaeota archaeon]|nr:hypothetical protein [Candidatus Bathyarchaeum sp.]
MRTQTIEIDSRFGEDYVGSYVFGEISWAKRNRIIQKHTRYHPVSGQVVKSDYVAIQAETIWASLKEQPQSEPISLERLLSEDVGIPIELGELFSQTANMLCSVTVEETRFLSGQSDEQSPTVQSQGFVSARNSGSHQPSSIGSQPKRCRSS